MVVWCDYGEVPEMTKDKKGVKGNTSEKSSKKWTIGVN